MKTLIENLIKNLRHAELVSCAKHTVTNLSTYILNVLKTNNTPHPNPVLDLLHAHRVSPKLLRNRRLNLLAIRTRFTPSVRKSALPQGAREQKCAFTLAETLITLGIIGIVAALTIPTLVQKYQEQETVTRLKKAYSTVSNAYMRILEEEGIPEDWGMDTDNFGDITTEKFAKYIKNVKVCNPAKNGKKCFERTSRKDLLGNTVNQIGSSPSLIMSDGMVIGFAYQDPSQLSNCGVMNRGVGCFQIHVDINGDKGPNQWGHDTFTFHAYRTGIIARGAVNTHGGGLCDPVNAIGWGGWPNGTACGAYVLQEGNMDYLKCIKGNTSYCSKKYYFVNY